MKKRGYKKTIIEHNKTHKGQKVRVDHVATLGCEGCGQEENELAYTIYDGLTHNEITVDQAVQKITNNNMSADTESEKIILGDGNNHYFGDTTDGRYALTYDGYSGAFDVWKYANDEPNDRFIELDEEEYVSLVKECVKRILSENIDTGQIPSVTDRKTKARERAAFEERPEIRDARTKLWRLRKAIEDAEDEGREEDVKAIQREICKIKDRYFKDTINEGGHIFSQDEKGNVYTNSTERWRNVPGTIFIWHGEWSDPEIHYKGNLINAVEVDDWLYDTYKAEKEGDNSDESFEDWVKEQGTQYLADFLDEYIDTLDDNNS